MTVLVPLVDCVVMYEDWFYLHRSEEAVFVNCTIVDVECDERLFGGNIAAVTIDTVKVGERC